MKIKVSYYIHGQTSDWRRGPFSALAVACEADKLAELKDEKVDIERHTEFVVVELLKIVAAGDYGKDD